MLLCLYVLYLPNWVVQEKQNANLTQYVRRQKRIVKQNCRNSKLIAQFRQKAYYLRVRGTFSGIQNALKPREKNFFSSRVLLLEERKMAGTEQDSTRTFLCFEPFSSSDGCERQEWYRLKVEQYQYCKSEAKCLKEFLESTFSTTFWNLFFGAFWELNFGCYVRHFWRFVTSHRRHHCPSARLIKTFGVTSSLLVLSFWWRI